MTFLTRTEIAYFWKLINANSYHEAAIFGETLLKKDPRDGAGIRFGVMDAYAVLGDSEAAEDLAIRYCGYAPEFWDGETYQTGKQVSAGWSKKQWEHWTEELDDVMAFQLVMAYWKDSVQQKEIAEETGSNGLFSAGAFESAAILEQRCLKVHLSQYAEEYIDMSESAIAEMDKYLETQPGYRLGSAEHFVACVSIPYSEQKGFRDWWHLSGRHLSGKHLQKALGNVEGNGSQASKSDISDKPDKSSEPSE